jgi:hypothetical protein
VSSSCTVAYANQRTQEWQNGDINLLAKDKALIQGTTLPRLLQTSQAQIRHGWLAYATVQEEDTPTNADTEENETKQHTPHEQAREFTIAIAFMHHQLLSSSLCSRNRPSVCIHLYHHHTAAGSGLKTAQPLHSPPHHILDLATMKLGQQDQAIRLSKALGKPPFGIAVGKP